MEKVRTIYSGKRKSGIPLIGDISWGTIFCQFYETEKDHVEILAPYFRAGIESNELCIWIPSGPLDAGDAGKALKKALPDFMEYVDKGQIEIIPRGDWFDEKGNTGGQGIVSRLDQAILSGFDGLRLACDVPPEMTGDKILSLDEMDTIGRCNVITVFSYPRERFDAAGLMQTVKHHRFALVRNTDRWELIESSEAGTIKDALKRSEEKLHSLFSNMSEGFANHRIVLDAVGKPCDYVFHEVNSAFEKLTGIQAENIIGRKATEVLPGIENDPVDWIGRYGRVALTGKPEKFENYSEHLGKWFSVSAFSPHKGYFAVTFSDITERKHAEEALRESERRWAVTLTSIGDAVIATDTKGRITFLNKVAEELTGWSLAEAAGKPVREVFHIVNEHTRSVVEDPVRKVLQTGMVVGLANHTLLIRKDGKELPIDDSGAPIRDQNGRILGVVLVFRDITERKQVEQALRENERRLSMAVSATADAIWEWDLVTNRTYYSPRWYAMLGYEDEEIPMDLVGWKGLCHPEDLQPTMDLIRSRLESADDEGYAAEFRMRSKAGSWVWILGRGRVVERDEGGKPVLLSGTNTDITERKQAEEELRRNEARYRILHETLRDGFVQVSMDGKIVESNRIFQEMLGYSPDELRTLTYVELTPERWHEFESRLVREQIISRGYSDVYEKEYRRKDGRTFPVELRTILSHDDTGRPSGMWATVRDITERKAAEEALKASLAEKEVLLKEIHHRVKNNLQVVSSLLELQAGEVRDDAVRGIFQDLNSRVRSMAMVHEKLYQSTDMAHVNFADYAQSLLGYLWQAQGSAASGIELNLDLNPVTLSVNTAVPCGLILNELFGNALKHAFHGRNCGKVLVSLREDEEGKVRLGVCDDGIGLPPQMDWEQSRSLGLRIVKTLARQLHAQVEVRNADGARFTILFER